MTDIILRSSDGTASLTLENYRRDSRGGAEFTFVVNSRGFTARSWSAQEPEELSSLLERLQGMYDSLRGAAEIRLHIEEERVSLAMEANGKLLVTGLIVHYDKPEHRLTFGFYSDQSSIPTFISGLANTTTP
jgi:hypothetical protein